MSRGTDHFGNGAEQLTKQQAIEQLQYELRHQAGTVRYDTKTYDDPDAYGDGIVIAKIGNQEVDHYIYHE